MSVLRCSCGWRSADTVTGGDRLMLRLAVGVAIETAIEHWERGEGHDVSCLPAARTAVESAARALRARRILRDA